MNLATFLPGFTETLVADQLTDPTSLEISPDGKLFVTEKAGSVEVYQDGVRLSEDFLAATPISVLSIGEGGLLGLTFDPDYAANHFVYLHYTHTSLRNRITRVTADPAGTQALPGSEVILFEMEDLVAPRHTGGGIHFGPDGKLYIGVGDNSVEFKPAPLGVPFEGDPQSAQSLTSLNGKILRINKDGSIPADNPFFDQTTGKYRAIWALGLRNPYTFAFQPGTGRLFINDVGEGLYEEVNLGQAGGNYGWPLREGTFDNLAFGSSDGLDSLDPFYAYLHRFGSFEGFCDAALSGGAFYNPSRARFPASFVGDYLFADFCQGFLRRLDPNTGQVEDIATGLLNPVDLRVDDQGNVYYLAFNLQSFNLVETGPVGQVYKISFDGFRGPLTTPATFDGQTATWYLQRFDADGEWEVAEFAYGGRGWGPVLGDWERSGVATVGVVDPQGMWYLRFTNTPGAPDVEPFLYGVPGWVPLTGDWDGDGRSGVGSFDASTATWYLRDTPDGGAPDVEPFVYGAPGWVPVVGDWDGDGVTTIGVFDPATATWFLRNSNSPGAADLVLQFGGPGFLPVVGDWDADGVTTVGVVDPTGRWYLRNTNDAGEPDLAPFFYGLNGWTPLGAATGSSTLMLTAAPGAPGPAGADPLDAAGLQVTVALALDRLRLAGVDPAVAEFLGRAVYVVAELPPGVLGQANAGTQSVRIDTDADGHGWFLDPTPRDDLEFTPLDPEAAGHMDLLTVLLHQMGHLIGLPDALGDGLMGNPLPTGTRRLDALDEVFARS